MLLKDLRPNNEVFDKTELDTWLEQEEEREELYNSDPEEGEDGTHISRGSR